MEIVNLLGISLDGEMEHEGFRVRGTGVGRKIGAELEIHSERGRGTRIELAVPAELAYRDFVSLGSRLWPRWLRLRRGAAAA